MFVFAEGFQSFFLVSFAQWTVFGGHSWSRSFLVGKGPALRRTKSPRVMGLFPLLAAPAQLRSQCLNSLELVRFVLDLNGTCLDFCHVRPRHGRAKHVPRQSARTVHVRPPCSRHLLAAPSPGRPGHGLTEACHGDKALWQGFQGKHAC